MDPNAALEQLRELATRIHNAHPRTNTTVEANDLAEVARGLDDWLSRGGFLPDAWRRGKIP